ncbi:hypothetical protein N0V94_005855 [Neodidymelliopsis sp. IMI 364377]|nr:hypothetical protein N0V94_005855 [Neodidymelliopsis sp. IMI 364377]
MEVAFQAKLNASNDGEFTLDDDWFGKRLDDFKEVHKQPQLDLVGWFTLGPSSGPGPHVLPIHSRITELYNDSPILLLFHPESTFTEATAAGKLPLTLYESLSESAPSDPNDKAMDIDGAVQAKAIKFRELVYSVETGEAEMISVDFVARGGGNATAVEGSVDASASAAESSKTNEGAAKKSKGKQKEKDVESEAPIDESAVLDADDEEILSSLTAKMNAIRMLGRRVALLRAYIDALPQSYLSDPSVPQGSAPDAQQSLPLDHTILRSISATLARLNILAPPDSDAFTLESQQEASDVQLVNLLASITNSVSSAKELGRKSQIVENARSQGKSRMGNIMGGYGGPPEGNFFDMGSGSGGMRAGGERWS